MKPDLPDRVAEMYEQDGELRIARVFSPGAAISRWIDDKGVVHPRLERLRTWFVGDDGLTQPERRIMFLEAEIAELTESCRGTN